MSITQKNIGHGFETMIMLCNHLMLYSIWTFFMLGLIEILGLFGGGLGQGWLTRVRLWVGVKIL
jgi:hypothetical protein